MKKAMKDLIKTSKKLGERVDTEWAEENEHLYENFAKQIELLYEKKLITAKEFNELALNAFYDYELKEE